MVPAPPPLCYVQCYVQALCISSRPKMCMSLEKRWKFHLALGTSSQQRFAKKGSCQRLRHICIGPCIVAWCCGHVWLGQRQRVNHETYGWWFCARGVAACDSATERQPEPFCQLCWPRAWDMRFSKNQAMWSDQEWALSSFPNKAVGVVTPKHRSTYGAPTLWAFGELDRISLSSV